jgi:dipeptidyl aminopeptidase/acylaminoacyl peptidase
MYPIRRYLNARAAYAPSFSPDGQQLAFLTDISGLHQVWSIPLDGNAPAWPDQLTFGQNRAMHASFAPSGTQLLFSRDAGGNENAQLYLLDPTSGELRVLTEGFPGAMHMPGTWDPNGSTYYYAANRNQPGLFGLYRQPLDGPAELLWQSEQSGYLLELTLAPDASRLAFTRVSSSFAHELWELDLFTMDVRQLNDRGTEAVYDHLVYLHDGRRLLCCANLGSDFRAVVQFDLETGSVAPIVEANWDVEALALSPNGRTLVYAVNEDGNSRLYRQAWPGGKPQPAPVINEFTGMLVPGWEDGLTFSPDGQRVAFAFSRPTRPTDVYVWDLTSNTLQAITRSSTGGIPPDRFVEPTLIHYPTFDERQIPAWYYRPEKADGPLPVVVLVHGGPESQTRPMFHFLIQYLLHHGYAVLAPNVRGSTGYGKIYAHLDDVEKRLDAVKDLGYAAHWLRSQPDVDANRLAVYGGSYGGFMVLAALTHQPELWAAGVDIVGISNFVTFLENTSDYRRAHREAEYGSLARDRELLQHISPINHLEAIASPLLVAHGANDPRVPLSEAEQIVAALEARSHPVDFLVFGDEGHGVVKLKNKLVLYPRIVDFLDKHLRG